MNLLFFGSHINSDLMQPCKDPQGGFTCIDVLPRTRGWWDSAVAYPYPTPQNEKHVCLLSLSHSSQVILHAIWCHLMASHLVSSPVFPSCLIQTYPASVYLLSLRRSTPCPSAVLFKSPSLPSRSAPLLRATMPSSKFYPVDILALDIWTFIFQHIYKAFQRRRLISGIQWILLKEPPQCNTSTSRTSRLRTRRTS